ncbi:pyrroline-5-carboxylate reductase [Oribacterium sp. C9]|uniref:pyrroline-5-carboxylate reductase n=1 Tax=Oribacterium sp. C9 TaxID=1943579 RepID=UPI00098F10DF|nr:pyrroline-5-carboxylate reductase [Oribacterium sp. C9]OON88294.1 pyrroline-5-carboxylate reductase [Oribacterium sp. C9]
MKTINELKIGYIGFGNMAGAIAQGLINSGFKASNMYAVAGHFDKLSEKCEKMGGINALLDPLELASASDIVFIAVKPNKIKDVITPLAEALSEEKVVISIAWGYDFERYFEEDVLKTGTHLICTCPNTPVSINKGIFVAENRHSLAEEELKSVEELLSNLGRLIFVDTKLMGASGTVCGCGPAFADLFMESMADAAVMYGIPRKTAYEMVSAMIEGNAALQLSSGKHPGEMKDEVCSPGGSTIRGVAALEEYGLRAAVIAAIKAIQEK